MTPPKLKVLHFSDAHLGLALYGLTQRIIDHADALKEVLRVAIEEEVDLVVDGGDTMDSSEPDPYSVGCYGKFVAELRSRGIPVVAVVGNHNIHRISSKVSQGTWMDAVGNVTRPISQADEDVVVAQFQNRAKDFEIALVAADWMPAEKAERFLAGLERDYRIDLLLMHQSCEGFEPDIGSPELQLNQLRGAAKVIALGDIHKAMTIDIEPHCRVTYPGSTELCSKSEATNKSVNIITFVKGEARADIRKVPIKSRPVLIGSANSAVELQALEYQVRQMAKIAKAGPLVVVDYNRELDMEMKEFRRSLAEDTTSLVRVVPITLIEKGPLEDVALQTTLMEEILPEHLARNPELHATALALWKSPKNWEVILTELKEQITKTITPAQAPAPTPL